jgi:hypothetical protein
VPAVCHIARRNRLERRDGPPRPQKTHPPAAPVHRTAAGALVLREATAEEARWRDPDDPDAHARAPKVVTALRRVDQLARLLDPARGNELAFWYA